MTDEAKRLRDIREYVQVMHMLGLSEGERCAYAYWKFGRLTLVEAGVVLGISKQAVQAIEQAAFSRLRRAAKPGAKRSPRTSAERHKRMMAASRKLKEFLC